MTVIVNQTRPFSDKLIIHFSIFVLFYSGSPHTFTHEYLLTGKKIRTASNSVRQPPREGRTTRIENDDRDHDHHDGIIRRRGRRGTCARARRSRCTMSKIHARCRTRPGGRCYGISTVSTSATGAARAAVDPRRTSKTTTARRLLEPGGERATSTTAKRGGVAAFTSRNWCAGSSPPRRGRGTTTTPTTVRRPAGRKRPHRVRHRTVVGRIGVHTRRARGHLRGGAVVTGRRHGGRHDELRTCGRAGIDDRGDDLRVGICPRERPTHPPVAVPSSAPRRRRDAPETLSDETHPRTIGRIDRTFPHVRGISPGMPHIATWE